MLVPEKYGGLGWTLPRVLQMEEALSWADGSVGWVVTLCAGAAWFAGFLDPSLVKEILRDDKACFAGSGAASGTARAIPNGFEINGAWKYASGSPHATVFTANCTIVRDGIPERNADGTPVVSAFLFLRDEVTLRRQWESMGMVATASHSFEVRQLHVRPGRRFLVDAAHARWKNPVYQYPFLQLAETTLAVNLSGMALRFIELCQGLFTAQDLPPRGRRHREELLAATSAKINEYRQRFFGAVDVSWHLCTRGQAIDPIVLREVSNNSHALVRESLRAVDDLYPWCGLVAAQPRTEINRVWRNIHTASQHALFRREEIQDSDDH